MAKGKGKAVIQRETASNSKQPRVTEDPQSFMGMHPTWSFKSLDNGYTKWGFSHSDDLFNDVICKLKDNEGMTWREIFSASGGRAHGTNSHYENVADLIPEAQKRWSDLKLEEYDRVFSLRLTNLHRLYGILEGGVFRIVWFDQKHEIYPTKK